MIESILLNNMLHKDANTVNLHRVLRAIWLNKGVSRVELAHGLSLDKSTITKIVNDLIAQGIVEAFAEGTASRQGGRKPIYLSVRKNSGCILGIEIQTEKYTVLGVNLENEIIFSRSCPIDFSVNSIQTAFFDILKSSSADIESSGLPLLGAGIGMSGIIDPKKGIIYQSYPLKIWEEIDFYSPLDKIVSVPVRIENDANCCCWAELVRLKSQRPKNFIFILGEFRKEETSDKEPGGLAIGMGLVLNGSVHYGECFSAGEFRSAFRTGNNKSQFSLPDEKIKHAEDDPEVFREVVRELGKNLAILVNTLNLSHVFVGGSIEKYRDIIIPVFREEIQKNWAYANAVNCSIEVSELGDRIVAFGAAGMFLEELFGLPEQEKGERINGLA